MASEVFVVKLRYATALVSPGGADVDDTVPRLRKMAVPCEPEDDVELKPWDVLGTTPLLVPLTSLRLR